MAHTVNITRLPNGTDHFDWPLHFCVLKVRRSTCRDFHVYPPAKSSCDWWKPSAQTPPRVLVFYFGTVGAIRAKIKY